MVDSNPSFEVVGSPGDFQTFFVVSTQLLYISPQAFPNGLVTTLRT